MAKSVKYIPATKNIFTAMPTMSISKRRVAAYARVSTDSDEQFTSYEAQIDYYTRYITKRDDWEFVKVYADEERPNKGVGDEFIDVERNGGASSQTIPLGLFRGNIALVIWCKAQTDGRAKKKLVRQIIAQCDKLVNNKVSDGFYFEFDPMNVITPTTVNLTSGYSTTVLNVSWRVTNDFINKLNK